MQDSSSDLKTEPTRSTQSFTVWGRFLLETLQTILLALVLYLLIDAVVARVRVENISMKPTLDPGEFIIVNKLAYRLGDFQRGDIIIFHFPQNVQDDYIKRVIGLPEDVIDVRNGTVHVNGQPMDEPYIVTPPEYMGEWIVPDDTLFVLGDNRNQSSDSHIWGFVPIENVIGRALVVYWPLDKMQILDHPDLVKAAN
ncbi:MAG: signal peptidase I [Chloroflexi bacterium]|jgi:signal peptidase I|nr:signal peptidase I [Anaerolineaceae bacterium]NMB86876.1 signal peptidase I [Chloroflexota bacterium]